MQGGAAAQRVVPGAPYTFPYFARGIAYHTVFWIANQLAKLKS